MIPEHKKCTNCGGCCYFILASKSEITKIKKYVLKNKIKPIKHFEMGKCYFRDEINKKCLIYSVRPTICKLFGVAKGMKCVNGNTLELDLKHVLKTDSPSLLNKIKWN